MAPVPGAQSAEHLSQGEGRGEGAGPPAPQPGSGRKVGVSGTCTPGPGGELGQEVTRSWVSPKGAGEAPSAIDNDIEFTALPKLAAGEPPVTRLCGNEYGKPPCRPVVDTYSRHCPVASDRLDLGARSGIMVPVNDIKTRKGVIWPEGRERVSEQRKKLRTMGN